MTDASSPAALYDLWNWIDESMVALAIAVAFGVCCGWAVCRFIRGRS
jgi:ABC-type sulfate transport system permease subunit